MKKILLILTICTTLFATGFSQNLRIVNPLTGLVVNNSTINLSANANSTIELPLYLTNTGNSPINVRVERFDRNLISGATHYFAWTYSYTPSAFVSPTAEFLQSKDTVKLFKGYYEGNGVVGTSQVRYKFYNNNNPNDSASVLVNYTGASVTSLSNSQKIKGNLEIFPNPVTTVSSVRYNLNGENGRAEVKIYNILGTVVRSIPLQDKQGIVNLKATDFKSGIYFCSLEVNGRVIETKKIAVK